MNWLNKLDSVLDNVHAFVNQDEENEDETTDENVNHIHSTCSNNADYFENDEIDVDRVNNVFLLQGRDHIDKSTEFDYLNKHDNTLNLPYNGSNEMNVKNSKNQNAQSTEPASDVVLNNKIKLPGTVSKSSLSNTDKPNDQPSYEPSTKITKHVNADERNVKSAANANVDAAANAVAELTTVSMTNDHIKSNVDNSTSSQKIDTSTGAKFNPVPMKATTSTTIRLPNRKVAMPRRIPARINNPLSRTRPGMIRSVIRYDISDDDSSSSSSSSSDGNRYGQGSLDNNNAQANIGDAPIMTVTKINSKQLESTSNNDNKKNMKSNVIIINKKNVSNANTALELIHDDEIIYDHDHDHDPLLSNQSSLSFVVQTNQSDDDQISPIASPKQSISTLDLDNTYTNTTTISRNDGTESELLPSLPNLLINERAQSTGTVPISNVRHNDSNYNSIDEEPLSPASLSPTVVQTQFPPPSSPSPLPPPPMQTISLTQQTELEPLQQDTQIPPQIQPSQGSEGHNNVQRQSHSNQQRYSYNDSSGHDRNSHSTVIIRNTSTLSSLDNTNNEKDHNGLGDGCDNDSMEKDLLDMNLIRGEHEEDEEERTSGVDKPEEKEKVEEDDTNIDSDRGNRLNALPTINGAINVIQATMGDYLFYDEVDTAIDEGNNDDNNHEKNDTEPENEEEEDMLHQKDEREDEREDEDEDEEFINEDEDYTIETPLIPWDEDDEIDIIDRDIFSPTGVFDPKWNCHGVVHVKLIRIQHLPMSAGNTLQAVISLPPWKGKIRSEKIISYDGPEFAGVCARWDEDESNDQDESVSEEDNADVEDNSQQNQQLAKTQLDEKFGENEMNSDDIPCHSMVHTYNNEDTPIPTISIEVHTQQMFNRGVHSFNLSCEPLMRNPGHFRRRWCISEKQNYPTTSFKTPQKHSQKHEVIINDETLDLENESETSPIILIEACFEPTSFTSTQNKSSESESAVDTSFSSINDRNENDENASYQSPDKRDRLESGDSFSNKRLRVKPHLFRVNTDWRPTYCAVCSTMMFRNGFRCEVCKLDCCEDCQLRVDVKLPCGSNIANTRVAQLLKSKLTVSKIYSIIAPVKETSENKSDAAVTSASSQGKDVGVPKTIDWSEGVGTLRLRIIKACLFQRPFPPESEISHILKHSDRWLRRGDHYARVSWTDSKETKRTKVVFQTAKPRFDSEELSITAMHYGTEFRIEVLDASTDASIGSTLITTQGLMQWQRDKIVEKGGLKLDSIIAQDPMDIEKRRFVLELRTGVKSGFGLDFYNSAKLKGSTHAGEISGWIEVETCFDEDPELYSNSKPKPCPSRPDADFNMELIQLHIARIFSIIEDVNEILSAYLYLVSWKSPALTSFSLFIFVMLCIKFNTEYFGSLPLASVVLYMLVLYSKRSKGYREYLQRKEKESSLKEIKGGTVQYNGHRPTGNLKVSITRGLHLTPQLGLGIPGSVISTIFWDPTKYLDDKWKKKVVEFDPSSKVLYHLGETESSAVTFNPEWRRIHDSDQLKRLKQLLPSTNFLSRSHSNYLEVDNDADAKQDFLEVPILQPIVERRIHTESLDEGDNDDTEHFDLVPWEESYGAVIIQIRFSDVLNKLPIFDQILGEVVIPFESIVNNGIDGWFQVLPKGTMETIEEFPVEERKTKEQKSILSRLTVPDHKPAPENEKNRVPCVYVKANFSKPSGNDSDISKETSVVVAEHMICNASASKDDRSSFIGSSLQTFNTVRGVTGQVQYLQNQLGNILDWVEIIQNTFNFTCPEKSALLLLGLGILWFLFSILPTRFVILCGGLGQYIATFMAMLNSNKKEKEKDPVEEIVDSDGYNPVVTRIFNFFQSIPTNEDLRRYYFWEARRVGDKEREVWAKKRRTRRLTKLYQAQWFGKLELKTPNKSASESDRDWDWISIFAIIQGHRFVWWKSEKDFDNGENPAGQIFFAGHSGLASLSPLELRELQKSEIRNVVNIFGRGSESKGQLKISLLVPDEIEKERLETAVLHATLDAKNE